MAKRSVQRTNHSEQIVSHPGFIYSDSPFERASARLNGIAALEVLADIAMESEEAPLPEVWNDLWYFIRIVTQDTKRDMYELLQSPVQGEAQP